jgi:hypothetical protein
MRVDPEEYSHITRQILAEEVEPGGEHCKGS